MSNGNNIAHSFKFFTLSLNPYQLLHSFVVIFWYIEEKKCVFRLTSALVLIWSNLLYSSYYQCIKLGSFWTSEKNSRANYPKTDTFDSGICSNFWVMSIMIWCSFAILYKMILDIISRIFRILCRIQTLQQ